MYKYSRSASAHVTNKLVATLAFILHLSFSLFSPTLECSGARQFKTTALMYYHTSHHIESDFLLMWLTIEKYRLSLWN